MDTEALIKMVKAKHAQSQSAADKQIQDKLGQLSSKLSWVVEYPRQNQDGAAAGQSGENFHPPGFPHGMADMEGEFPEEGQEEDYDEEYDEDELDEHELAALAQMRKAESSAIPGHQRGHFEGEIGDEEYGEDYDQEMEEFDVQHRVYAPMGEYGDGADAAAAEGSQDQGFSGYQRTSSPSLENYLLIGNMMAKCMVCNKLVRKSEVKQHNQLHDEFVEEEEEGEDGGEAGYMDEGEGLHDGQQEAGFEGEEDYHGEVFPGEEGEEDLDMTEFTAQPLVAEKLNPQLSISSNSSEKKSDQKSTVCDICNKNFKSHGNMVRHKKIHTDVRDVYCPICHKSFKLQVYLSKHLKKVHPNYEAQQGGDGDSGAVAQDGGAEEETEGKSQS